MEWSVTTHEHRERTADWYWGLGVLALAGGVAAIFFGNFLFAVIIAIGAVSIGFLAARGPREHRMRIDDRGLVIDGTRYPYSAVHSFWVEHEADNPHLFMTMKGILSSHFSLTLDSEAQGTEVREHLGQHIQEAEQGPHVGEQLAHLLGL
jgi:hypothetical protein